MNLHWHSNIEKLFKGKVSKTCQKLTSANIETLYDLLWVIPLRATKVNYGLTEENNEGDLVYSNARIISKQLSPGRTGKHHLKLKNITLNAQDIDTKKIFQIKWFNAYPSHVKKVTEQEYINICGKISIFNGQTQITNPEIGPKNKSREIHVEYPTINTVSGQKIKAVIDKIPSVLWNEIPSIVPASINQSLTINNAFMALHCKKNTHELINRNIAIQRIVYEELFLEQVYLFQRKQKRMSSKISPIDINIRPSVKKFKKSLPFKLTS